MNPEGGQPTPLKLFTPRRTTRAYPWWGLFLGIGTGFFVLHPLAMLVQHIHAAIYDQTPFIPLLALTHSLSLHMWPMMLLYSMAGGAVGVVLGRIFQSLQEHRQILELLHHEFELQVATQRHHYKNLVIGIRGFSERIRRKLGELNHHLVECAAQDCPRHSQFHDDIGSLEHSAAILDDTAQRLTVTLGQELLFLKALTTASLNLEDKDLYPLLTAAVRDLLSLRFRDKHLRVDINGRPWEECADRLVFPFEPYAMEVILQNLLSNAMKHGDHLRLEVAEVGGLVRVAVRDNGPGMDVEKFQRHLAALADRREADSSGLGLKVTLHLLEKCGGRLWVWSKPGAGAAFTVEFPKHPKGHR